MRILAIDPGSRYLGLALAEDEIKIAMPYGVLEIKCHEDLFGKLEEIIAREKIGKIVIGRPIGLSGRETEQTKNTDHFIEEVKQKIKLPVVIVDERLTSKMADKLLSNKAENHAVAAGIILQNYLDKEV